MQVNVIQKLRVFSALASHFLSLMTLLLPANNSRPSTWLCSKLVYFLPMCGKYQAWFLQLFWLFQPLCPWLHLLAHPVLLVQPLAGTHALVFCLPRTHKPLAATIPSSLLICIPDLRHLAEVGSHEASEKMTCLNYEQKGRKRNLLIQG